MAKFGPMESKEYIPAADILEALKQQRNEEQCQVLCRFFKTGPGEYGEGDQFLGLKVPQTRTIVKQVRLKVPMPEIEKLLYSPWHEARLCGLLLLVEEMAAALPRKKDDPLAGAAKRKEIVDFYLKHARQSNNWDLVDLSCEYILGEWLLYESAEKADILDRLAESDNLWVQRIAIVTTLRLIRANRFDETIRISKKLLNHPHDLIHKAVGWMLREMGKRDPDLLRRFLAENYPQLPRTTLRYAIEKFTPSERQRWLNRQ